MIPQAMLDRAGLAPGMQVALRFHNGAVEIAPVVPQMAWEHVGRVRYPVLSDPGLTTDQIGALIEEGRSLRA